MARSEIGAVTALWRYPVSSLGGERRSSLHVSPSGVTGDRSHALVDAETGQTINPAQRQWQFAPQILSRIGEDGTPELSTDGRFWHSADEREFRAAMAKAFGREVRLHPYGTALESTAVSHRYPLSPLHLVSQQAIATLRRLVPGAQIDERRFRPNVVVDFPSATGTTPPEYSLIGQEFRIGNLRLRGMVKAGRCSFTTLKQLGLTEERSVLQALIAHFERDFGIYCEILDDGDITTGDRLALEEETLPVSPVVIVGAGQAAGTAAKALRELGYDGEIRIFGDEVRAPYERPPLSKSFTAASGDRPNLTHVLTPDEAAGLGVKLHLGEPVVAIDRAARTVETQDGARHPYGRLILATGGAAKAVSHLNRGHGRILTLRTADDADALARGLAGARSVFVLGGGWLGLEIAAAAREKGLDVTLFARQRRVCSRALPAVVADAVAALHHEKGVRLVLGCEPDFTEHAGHVEAALDGETAKADLLVVAIGITANDALARRAGLDCDEGVITDENGATADPLIYAVGDVSRQRAAASDRGLRIESWHNANEQAVRAARSILGLDNAEPALPRFWSDQFGQTIHIAGMPDPNAPAPRNADNTFWEFGNFAIGINQPTRVHQFAMARRAAGAEAGDTGEATPEGPPPGTARQPFPDISDLEERELRKVRFEPLGNLVVTRIGSNTFAVAERCPHADASLAEGMIDGMRIVCPLHFAEFDLRNGRPYNAPKGCPNARTWRITEEDGRAWIWVAEA